MIELTIHDTDGAARTVRIGARTGDAYAPPEPPALPGPLDEVSDADIRSAVVLVAGVLAAAALLALAGVLS